MPKPISRAYANYTLDAIALMGALIREARVRRDLTASDVATRAGISRALLGRIERGYAGCSIGAVFEVATVCGVSLFDLDARAMAHQLAHQQEKLCLLPQSVRAKVQPFNDDF